MQKNISYLCNGIWPVLINILQVHSTESAPWRFAYIKPSTVVQIFRQVVEWWLPMQNGLCSLTTVCSISDQVLPVVMKDSIK